MKTLGWALLVGGGYLLWKGWQKVSAAQNLTFSIKRIKYVSTDLSQTRLDLELSIINPSNETFSFDKFFGQLRFKGTLLVNVIRDGTGSGITIKPANETVISIPVYINHLATALAAIEVLEKLAAKQAVEGLVLQGMLYANGVGLPLAQTMNLNFGTAQPAVRGINNCFTAGVLN